jgi:hypothetical protein
MIQPSEGASSHALSATRAGDVHHVRIGGGELVMADSSRVCVANVNPNIPYYLYQPAWVYSGQSRVSADVDANGTIVCGALGGGVYAYGGFYGAPYEVTTCTASVVAG